MSKIHLPMDDYDVVLVVVVVVAAGAAVVMVNCSNN
jgi:hypothetical protein